jgi:hypothetical protein
VETRILKHTILTTGSPAFECGFAAIATEQNIQTSVEPIMMTQATQNVLAPDATASLWRTSSCGLKVKGMQGSVGVEGTDQEHGTRLVATTTIKRPSPIQILSLLPRFAAYTNPGRASIE